MIVPMKKVSLVLTESTRRESLKALRRAGLMHIEREEEKAGPEGLRNEVDTLKAALTHLPKAAPGSGRADRAAAQQQAKSILAIKEKESAVLDNLMRYSADMETLAPWGDFNPADIRILAAKGVELRLVIADKALRDHLSACMESEFITLRQSRKKTYAVVVFRGKIPEDAVSGVKLPENGLEELRSLMAEARAELKNLAQALTEKAEFASLLEAALLEAAQDLEFEEVNLSLNGEERLSWFSGYIAAEEAETLKSLAAAQSWGIMLRDPGPEDQPPTQIRNSQTVGIIKPVFDLMGIFPGYRESDISAWFLFFLSIFAAMIFGDAGFGFIILILVSIMRLKSGKGSNLLRLLMIFGLTTVIWGTLTGTWFSSLSLVRDSFLRRLVIPALATYQEDLFPGHRVTMGIFPGDSLNSTDMVKWLSLLIGGVMLTIARVKNFIGKLPSLSAVAQLGWLSVVLALYWLVMRLVLQLSPPPFIMDLILPMALGGMFVVLIFEGQDRGVSFIKGILAGVKNILPTVLNSIGVFSDIISFIRLFAIGVAGVALTQSFNSMAPQNGGIAIIGTVIILALGYSLNMALNSLSVLAHGVRLNVLEFSGHLDIEWAGFGFEPFRLHAPEPESSETDKESTS